MFALRGKTALITGASKGLGADFAEALAARGANVVLVARSGAALAAMAQRLSAQHHVQALALEADLGLPGEAQRLLAQLTQHGVQVDLLINNAGFGSSGHFLDQALERELDQVRLNINALLAMTHVFGQQMRLRSQGGIINVASNAAFQGVPYQATYAATKAFVLHHSEAIAAELASHGVHVMAACPGPTATSFFAQMPTTLPAAAMDCSAVVACNTLDAFERGARVAYPGRFSVRLGALAAQLLPRALVQKLAAAASRKMGLHLPA
jgi:short-subunit dehydrogenase